MTEPTFSTNSLVFAEEYLASPISAIIDEARSDAGLSLKSLRALYAALHLRHPNFHTPDMMRFLYQDALARAGEEIDKLGAAVVATEVGAAMARFIAATLRERNQNGD